MVRPARHAANGAADNRTVRSPDAGHHECPITLRTPGDPHETPHPNDHEPEHELFDLQGVLSAGSPRRPACHAEGRGSSPISRFVESPANEGFSRLLSPCSGEVREPFSRLDRNWSENWLGLEDRAGVVAGAAHELFEQLDVAVAEPEQLGRRPHRHAGVGLPEQRDGAAGVDVADAEDRGACVRVVGCCDPISRGARNAALAGSSERSVLVTCG
jgi:hypothetical protein